MNTSTAQLLEPFFVGRGGDDLPLATDLDLIAWNCTNVVDALDESKTREKKFPSGSGYMHVTHYAIHADRIRDEHVFKVPQLRASDIFVSDAEAACSARRDTSVSGPSPRRR